MREEPTIFHPGQKCRRSGVYTRLDEWENDILTEGGDAAEITLSEGEHFPPTERPGMTFRLARAATHQRRGDN